MTTATIKYKPRKQMKAFHNRKERFACIVAHRRFGKTARSGLNAHRAVLATGNLDDRISRQRRYLHLDGLFTVF